MKLVSSYHTLKSNFFSSNLTCLTVIGRHVEIHKRTGTQRMSLADLPGSDMLKSNRHMTVLIQISKGDMTYP